VSRATLAFRLQQIPKALLWATLMLVPVLLVSTPARASDLPSELADDDSVIVQRVVSASNFDTLWNIWLIAWLRWRTTASDSAASGRFEQRLNAVARIEQERLGTSIASEALGLVRSWDVAQIRRRIRAQEAESLAHSQFQLGGLASAEPHYLEALTLYRALGERRRLAVTLGGFGAALLLSNATARADSVYALALDARKAIGDERLVANTLNDLGLVRRKQNRRVEALDYLSRAAEIRRTTGQPGQLGGTLNFLALTASELGRHDGVDSLYREALALTVAAGDSMRTLTVLVNFSGWLGDSGDPEEAAALAARGVALAQELGQELNESKALLNQGAALRVRCRYSEAISALTRAVRVARAAGSAEDAALALIELGHARLDCSDLVNARRATQAALAVADSAGFTSLRVKTRNNLALCFLGTGRTNDALPIARKAIQIATADGDSAGVKDVSRTLGNLELSRGDLESSAAWFRRAAASGPALSEEVRASDLVNLGWAEIFLNHPDDAAPRFAEGLRIARAADVPEVAWRAQHGLGEVAERAGRYSEALEHLRVAAATIDTMRSIQRASERAVRYFADRQAGFEALIHLLGRLAPEEPALGEEAFTWAERARARALSDLLEHNGITPPRPARMTLAAVRDRLESDEALLYYAVGDSSTTLWVVRAGAESRFTLPARSWLRRRVDRFRELISIPESAASEPALQLAASLFNTLLAPAIAILGDVKHLRVAPDGPLWSLPFEALRMNAEGAPRYVLQRWDVSYVPSALSIVSPAPTNPDSSILVVADPEYDPRSAVPLARLPGTRAELQVLQRLSPAPVLRAPLTGRMATRSGLLRSGWFSSARLIHIGAHGDLATDPDRSGIWLAADESGNPSKLTVSDILRARPRANLVTLSACQTGLGLLERGEGVLGLTRAFLSGGSGSVLVSLWDTNDVWAARLFEEFYRAYLVDEMEAFEALAKAKRTLLEKTGARSPYYWAPFVCVSQASGR